MAECSIENCSSCATDDINKCEECSEGYELTENECSKLDHYF